MLPAPVNLDFIFSFSSFLMYLIFQIEINTKQYLPVPIHSAKVESLFILITKPQQSFGLRKNKTKQNVAFI